MKVALQTPLSIAPAGYSSHAAFLQHTAHVHSSSQVQVLQHALHTYFHHLLDPARVHTLNSLSSHSLLPTFSALQA